MLGRCVEIDEYTGSSTPSSKKAFVWCGNARCETRDAANSYALLNQFFPRGETISGTSYYFTKDHLGSIRELTNSSGSIVYQQSFDPWGIPTTIVSTTPGDFGFCGYYLHSRSGLNLTRTRAYSASLGRFINRDPVEEAGGVNLYGYVANNPASFRDPSGLQIAFPPVPMPLPHPPAPPSQPALPHPPAPPSGGPLPQPPAPKSCPAHPHPPAPPSGGPLPNYGTPPDNTGGLPPGATASNSGGGSGGGPGSDDGSGLVNGHNTFDNSGYLGDQFGYHGDSVGANSPEEYDAMARSQFFDPNADVTVRPDGTVVVFDPVTGNIGYYTSNGTPINFYGTGDR